MTLPVTVRIAALAICALAADAAHAQARGDVCYGPADASLPTNATVFACPQAGSKTVPQLAADGWRIVSMTGVVSGNGQSVQIVVQRIDRLFRSGFERP